MNITEEYFIFLAWLMNDSIDEIYKHTSDDRSKGEG